MFVYSFVFVAYAISFVALALFLRNFDAPYLFVLVALALTLVHAQFKFNALSFFVLVVWALALLYYKFAALKQERDLARLEFKEMDNQRLQESVKRVHAERDRILAEMRAERAEMRAERAEMRAAEAGPRRVCEFCPGCEQAHAICVICTEEVAVWAHTPCGHRTHCLGCYPRRPQQPGYARCEVCREVALYDTRIY